MKYKYIIDDKIWLKLLLIDKKGYFTIQNENLYLNIY